MIMMTHKQKIGLAIASVWIVGVVTSIFIFRQMSIVAFLGVLPILLFPFRKTN